MTVTGAEIVKINLVITVFRRAPAFAHLMG
jgi:hypothetical protein